MIGAVREGSFMLLANFWSDKEKEVSDLPPVSEINTGLNP
jgi:hypothetical protein